MEQQVGKKYAKEYTSEELMVIEASRYIADEDTVVVGTGLPMIASMFAQKAHAPNVNLLIESGVIDPIFTSVPISVTDPRMMTRAAKLGATREVLGSMLQRGLVDIGFLGGAQIDQFANINSTYIGNPDSPKVRLPGSGGANGIASNVDKILIIVQHEKRRFPERCDYITSPGYIDGSEGRKRAGLRTEKPDIIVVTNLCVMRVDPSTGRLVVVKLMPGVTKEEVLENTAFVPKIAEGVKFVEPPANEELRILRDEVDPEREYLPG